MRVSDWSSDVCSSDLCRAASAPMFWNIGSCAALNRGTSLGQAIRLMKQTRQGSGAQAALRQIIRQTLRPFGERTPGSLGQDQRPFGIDRKTAVSVTKVSVRGGQGGHRYQKNKK